MGSFHDDLLEKVANYCSRYFRENLREREEQQEALATAGITKDVIDDFQVGYAPGDWSSLTDRLRSDERDYILDCARTLGVVARGKRGLHDRFRNRYVLPVFSDEGSVVGFSSVLEQTLNPNYESREFDLIKLNSSHSPIFNKRNFLLGATQAKQAVQEDGLLLVADDPMDVLIFHARNRCNVVAELVSGALGSAPPGSQTGAFRRSANRIYRIKSRNETREKPGDTPKG